MVHHLNRETYRRWKVILEIERFISANDNAYFETRRKFYANYYRQLQRLLDCDQLSIKRGPLNEIIAVCGWALIRKSDEWDVNKVRWTLPKNLCEGNVLYVSFCVARDGGFKDIRKELVERYQDKIDEMYWFSAKKHKFIRRKNTLKEMKLCKTAA